MSEIQFDEQNSFKSREILGGYRKPGMVDWLQRKGVVKSEKSASLILVGVIVVCVVLAGMIIFRDSIFGGQTSESVSEPLSPAELEQLPPEVRDLILESQNQ